ncbi:siderophore-interacting protein [Micromonospora endophytica]|uniref:NADPH-dependent ferric siderophore reductase n=1 Tax=Micromonospora endophytica TaxID=515350 RepID=A0A2W2CD21_9ACTN|nr:siderophore-interacting protein [Micromonospora endophytica]PZF95620.1 NADPH-dependent ferric siderophore reductase [Micromonospora endophytica]RIW40531.1 siderophore-interacting protein [Micromonospora endophytica]BCJ58954.1 siderophore-interacting protein [Micromonospora endophytica]
MKRNWEALVLKAFGGRTFQLTVLDSEPVGDHYQRLLIDGGELLQTCEVHPTMWIRLWFDNEGRSHQRAYTLVDPDPDSGRFHLVFALHDGCATRWATSARPGDTIEATVQGSSFTLPDPAPTRVYLIGDAASLPAINSLLDVAGPASATVWIEYAHEGERVLPLRTRPHDEVVWVPRRDNGGHLVETVTTALDAGDDGALYWVACEAASTRNIVKHLRRTLGVGKENVDALAYWRVR